MRRGEEVACFQTSESLPTWPYLPVTQKGLMVLLWMAVSWMEKQLSQSEPLWAGQMSMTSQSCDRFRRTGTYWCHQLELGHWPSKSLSRFLIFQHTKSRTRYAWCLWFKRLHGPTQRGVWWGNVGRKRLVEEPTCTTPKYQKCIVRICVKKADWLMWFLSGGGFETEATLNVLHTSIKNKHQYLRVTPLHVC